LGIKKKGVVISTKEFFEAKIPQICHILKAKRAKITTFKL
jgi:hypothetical protein